MNKEKKKSKTKKRIGMAVVIIILMLVIWSLFLNQSTKIEIVKGVQPLRSDIAYKIFTSGDVKSITSHQLLSEVSGKVETLHKKVGDPVEVGEPILTLDVSDLSAQLEDLMLELKIAHATLGQLSSPNSEARQVQSQGLEMAYDQAQKNYDEAVALEAAGAYSQQQVTQAKTALQNAYQALLADRESLKNAQSGSEREIQKLRIEGIEMRITRIEESLAKSVITSPVSGTLTELLVDAHDRVMLNSPLGKVEDITHLEVVTNINQYDISKIQEGLKVKVTADGLKNESFEGQITRISSTAVKTVSGQGQETIVPVTISLDNASGAFKPNFTAKVEIVVDQAEGVLTIPYEVIRVLPDQTRVVYVIKDNVLTEKVITTGIESEVALEVTSDNISQDDVLLMNPTEDHHEGMTVMLDGEEGK